MDHHLEGSVVGAYRVVERLGQGGMGTVWRARDEKLERDVAIKMLRADTGPSEENTQRLLIEARAAACIQSRHVAQVLQLGTTDSGEPYVVMELLQGKTLWEVVTRERKLMPARAVRIASHVARAMQAAHALGVVHRDLKPANVMLVKIDGEEEVAKVLDFGIAKRTRAHDAELTGTGVLLGTLHYMAPEQIDGHAVDERSDIYSLGALMYRMLAGRNVFESPSLRELSDLVVFALPRPVRDFASIPKRLDDLVLRCLQKKPEDRFQSMSEVLTALDGALERDTESFLRDELQQQQQHSPSPARFFPSPAPRLLALAPPAIAPAPRSAVVDTAPIGVPIGAPALEVPKPISALLSASGSNVGEETADEVALAFVARSAAKRSVALVVAAAGLVILAACLAMRGEARAAELAGRPSNDSTAATMIANANDGANIGANASGANGATVGGTNASGATANGPSARASRTSSVDGAPSGGVEPASAPGKAPVARSGFFHVRTAVTP